MEKKDKIKEAYGEYWEQVKDEVTEDGFVPYRLMEDSKGIIFDFKQLHIVYGNKEPYVRPVCLLNIEDNNGWTKIKSEKDFPKVEDKYYTISKENKEYVRSDTYDKSPVNQYWWINNITHYQPIIKPLPPIY